MNSRRPLTDAEPRALALSSHNDWAEREYEAHSSESCAPGRAVDDWDGARQLQPAEIRRGQAREMRAGVLSGIDFRSVRPAYAELPVIQPGSKSAARRYKGPVSRASVLDERAVARVVDCIVSQSRSPESDHLKLWLSVRGGLRAGEIAHLPVAAMLDARGRTAERFEVYASKTRSKRMLHMHPEIQIALERLLRRYPEATHAAFSISGAGEPRRQSASVVANWFHRLYRAAGLIGCSSHSGRRTFATQFARLAPLYGASTKDLQLALGHASLSSTECYLEPSDRVGQLVRALGS